MKAYIPYLRNGNECEESGSRGRRFFVNKVGMKRAPQETE